MIDKCFICTKPVPDFVPEYCCSGFQCGCRGVPLEPWCCCSQKCEEALLDFISTGLPYDEIRKKAGIELWKE